MKLLWHSMVMFALLGSHCHSLQTQTQHSADLRQERNLGAGIAVSNKYPAASDAGLVKDNSAPVKTVTAQLEGIWQSSCLLDVVDKLVLHRQQWLSKIHQSEHRAEQHVPQTPISGAITAIADSVGWEQAAEAKVRRRQVTITSLTTSTSAAPSTASPSSDNNGNGTGNCSGNGNGDSGNGNGDVSCTNVGNSGASDTSSGGLSRSNQIAIGTGVGGGCVSLIGVIIAYNQCRRSKREARANKRGGAKPGSAGTEMHGGIVAAEA